MNVAIVNAAADCQTARALEAHGYQVSYLGDAQDLAQDRNASAIVLCASSHVARSAALGAGRLLVAQCSDCTNRDQARKTADFINLVLSMHRWKDRSEGLRKPAPKEETSIFSALFPAMESGFVA